MQKSCFCRWLPSLSPCLPGTFWLTPLLGRLLLPTLLVDLLRFFIVFSTFLRWKAESFGYSRASQVEICQVSSKSCRWRRVCSQLGLSWSNCRRNPSTCPRAELREGRALRVHNDITLWPRQLRSLWARFRGPFKVCF